MGHPYRIREIAVQAGLSERTVDRVLNNRGGVRRNTVREVQQAITDLDRQQTQLRLTGRTFMIDVVMQAPQRFSSAVRDALEAELPSLRPAAVRSRFHFRETCPVEDLVATLDGIRSRGSHGVILKAPDLPEIITACWRLVQAGIPVVTLVTDLPGSQRLAYVGMDNGPQARPRHTSWANGSATGRATSSSPSAETSSAARKNVRWGSAARCAPISRPLLGRDRQHRRSRRNNARSRPRRPGIRPGHQRGVLHRRRQHAIVEAFASRRTCRLHRPRPRPGQHPVIARRADISGHPPRPQPRHAPRLPRHHAGTQSAARRDLLVALEHPRHHAIQHALPSHVRAICPTDG